MICTAWGHRISVKANYCEACGTPIEKEDKNIMAKQGMHHIKYIIAGMVSLALMLVCLTGFTVNAAVGNGINTDVRSNDRVWNLGMISMDYSVCQDNV